MFDLANEFLKKHRESVDQLVRQLTALDKSLLLHSELVDVAEDFCSTAEGMVLRGSLLYEVLSAAQEAVVGEATIVFAVRWSVARWSYVQLLIDEMKLEETSASGFLRQRRIALRWWGSPTATGNRLETLRAWFSPTPRNSIDRAWRGTPQPLSFKPTV